MTATPRRERAPSAGALTSTNSRSGPSRSPSSFAVARADIDRRLRGQAPLLKMASNSCAIVAAEEHVVADQRKAAASPTPTKVSADSERARGGVLGGRGVAGLAERAGAERRHIAVEHDRVRGETLAAAASRRRERGRLRRRSARPRPRTRKRAPARSATSSTNASASRRMPPSTYQTPCAFDMGDQHQRRRRQKRRRAAIGGVAARTTAAGADRGNARPSAPQSVANGEIAIRSRAHRTSRRAPPATRGSGRDARMKVWSSVRTACSRCAPRRRDSRALRRAGEFADRLARWRRRRRRDRAASRRPRRGAPERRRAFKLQMIAERGAGAREQFLEHLAHREHGRTGVDLVARDFAFAHLSAGPRGAFEHERVEAVRGREQRGDEPADAAPITMTRRSSHRARPCRSDEKD